MAHYIERLIDRGVIVRGQQPAMNQTEIHPRIVANEFGEITELVDKAL